MLKRTSFAKRLQICIWYLDALHFWISLCCGQCSWLDRPWLVLYHLHVHTQIHGHLPITTNKQSGKTFTINVIRTWSMYNNYLYSEALQHYQKSWILIRFSLLKNQDRINEIMEKIGDPPIWYHQRGREKHVCLWCRPRGHSSQSCTPPPLCWVASRWRCNHSTAPSTPQAPGNSPSLSHTCQCESGQSQEEPV